MNFYILSEIVPFREFLKIFFKNPVTLFGRFAFICVRLVLPLPEAMATAPLFSSATDAVRPVVPVPVAVAVSDSLVIALPASPPVLRGYGAAVGNAIAALQSSSPVPLVAGEGVAVVPLVPADGPWQSGSQLLVLAAASPDWFLPEL